MANERRNTFLFKYLDHDVGSLRRLSDQMTTIGKNSFKADYGLILDLLSVKVNKEALITLAQFYDPPLRCFTFQDFQLAPTLEEFEKILGCNMKGQDLYLGLGENINPKMIAKALHIDVRDVAPYMEKAAGFPRKFLEDKARALLITKD